MRINAGKTKVMVTAKDTKSADISIEGKPIEEMQKFSYLGQITTEDACCETERRSRMAVAKT